ncbi:biotin-dependent carboxyltransferase family protein [Neobacillus sp. PS2-9]|uniref:5-oxoprolinase subunit C family protein n=1 Tax=Neobacillus sp. PS2-9 TaxID=3070676 RepID=UPI0027DF192F|nr:biotin-dependent carboxyltransferase family protein [Neobacillus sp. PS2-9]WML59284.1 biotin-dependent carboxyltransferase family protein [Neobacillus sp. PS2-9]
MKTVIFKVIKPGLQSTVQDLGRYGYQQFGISPSGAMDSYSMQLANILVGNLPGEAVLEVSFTGPVLEACSHMVIAICGGDFSPKVDDREAPMWKSFLLKKGETLSLGSCKQGARAYVAVCGGIDVPVVLNSKSTSLIGRFGGYEGRTLQKKDLIFGEPVIRKPLKSLPPKFIPHFKKQLTVRVILGPHVQRFTGLSIERFLSEEFIVTPQSNRMGFQLNGPKLDHVQGPDIISDPIPLGGIQVPASGQPIILMADRQTTGGYTRIGTVISVDIPLLAQAVPDTKIQFVEVSLKEAQRLYFERLLFLKHLCLAAK